MAQKNVEIPGIGPVTLAKRRGSKNLRISIRPDNSVRISMPIWVPYATGISFALKKRDWILKYKSTDKRFLLEHGQRLFILRF
jgi:predicted metal-dependent hydrolase